MKKTSKKSKKSVDKRISKWYLMQATPRERKTCKKEPEKRFGKIKKTLDKQISASYTNKAVAAEATARKRKSPEKIFKKDKFPVDKLKTA